MLTLGQAKTLLNRYVGANNVANDRINLVLERLIKSGNWRETKELLSFTAYADANGNAIITLPRQFNTVLAGVFVTGANCGAPLGVKNTWYQYLPSGPGIESGLSVDSFIPVEGRYCTYAEWSTPMLLRFSFEQSESPGTIIVKGTLAGEKIYSTYFATWIEGVAVAYTGSTTVTTTQLFDRPPYQIIKPISLGRVTMSTVDSSGVVTPVALFDPDEVNPSWRRYRVPSCTSPSTIMLPASQFYTKADIDAMFGDSDTITVNADGTHLLAPQVGYVEWNQPISALAGSVPYVAKFVLDPSYPMDNATFRINIDLAASTNPEIQIYDGAANTLLQQIDGDATNARAFYFEARWTGAAWIKIAGYFLP